MIQVQVSARALKNIERFVEHLLAHESSNAPLVSGVIERGLLLLREHPLIGRAHRKMRELVIGRPPLNYVALYTYNPATRIVLIHAIRHQREGRYH